MPEYVSLEEMQEAVRLAEAEAVRLAEAEAVRLAEAGAAGASVEAHKERLDRQALQASVTAAMKNL